jgi:hypothetical protein
VGEKAMDRASESGAESGTSPRRTPGSIPTRTRILGLTPERHPGGRRGPFPPGHGSRFPSQAMAEPIGGIRGLSNAQGGLP